MLCNLVAGITLTLSAHAFTLMPAAGNDGARWRDQPIQFKINYDNAPFARSQIDDLFNSAFSLWNSITSASLRMEISGETSAIAADLLSGKTTANAIVFDRTFEKDLPGTNASVLAVGTSVHEGDRFIQGIVVVNAQDGTPDVDLLRLIIAHESGHVFGLGHSTDPAAIMYPVAHPMDRPAQDDVDGVTFLYPKQEPSTGPFGCARIENQARPSPPNGIGLVWALGFVVVWILVRGGRASRPSPESGP